MKSITILSSLTTAVALSLGLLAGPASAQGLGADFSVDQTCATNDPPNNPCSETADTLDQAPLTGVDHVNFDYSAVVNQQQTGGTFLDGDDHFDEAGFAFWTGLVDDINDPVLGSLINFDYQVYMLFQADGTAGVNAGGTGIDVVFNSFSIEIFMDDDGDTTIALPADPALGGATTGNDADDNLLATANLLVTGEAHLFAGLAEGDFDLILSDFGLELFGSDFLTDPDPFYTLMELLGVTNNIQGASLTDPFIATLEGAGQLFFQQVPEPATLGLFGAGLLLIGMVWRRRTFRS